MGPLLRLAAATMSLIVILGFAAFVADEAGKGSRQQVEKLGAELGEPDPSAPAEDARERRHGPVREALDDANDVLLGPFTGVVTSRNAWVRRLVPTVLALVVYGLGLGLLANFIPRQRRRTGDWRAA